MGEGTGLFGPLVVLEEGAGFTGLRTEGFHRYAFHGWVLVWLVCQPRLGGMG